MVAYLVGSGSSFESFTCLLQPCVVKYFVNTFLACIVPGPDPDPDPELFEPNPDPILHRCKERHMNEGEI